MDTALFEKEVMSLEESIRIHFERRIEELKECDNPSAFEILGAEDLLSRFDQHVQYLKVLIHKLNHSEDRLKQATEELSVLHSVKSQIVDELDTEKLINEGLQDLIDGKKVQIRGSRRHSEQKERVPSNTKPGNTDLHSGVKTEAEHKDVAEVCETETDKEI